MVRDCKIHDDVYVAAKIGNQHDPCDGRKIRKSLIQPKRL